MSFRRLGLVGSLLTAACDGPTEAVPVAVPEFAAPTVVGPPVSSSGWEDSGYITPDGQNLYFTYLRIDPITFLTTGRVSVIGPARPGWPTTPPGDTLGAELYHSRLVGGVWTEPQNLGEPVNLPFDLEGDEWVSADGNRILFTNGVANPVRPTQTIYYAERRNGAWQTPVPARDAGFPFLAGDENPHLTEDERTLFFESARAGGFGRQDIWMSTKTGEVWGPAANLGAAVNTAGVEGSPFSLDGRELYFDGKGDPGISWTARDERGQWLPARVILPGTFGDPSLTRAGDLYVIRGEQTPDGGFGADVYLARRVRR